MSYKFIKTPDPDNEFDTTSVTIETNIQAMTTTELCEMFEDFLKACSFNFEGTVVIVDEDYTNEV